MIKYEINEIRSFRGKTYGYKVLTYADVPGIDHKILINTRRFDSKDVAEAYIEHQKKQKDHFTLF